MLCFYLQKDYYVCFCVPFLHGFLTSVTRTRMIAGQLKRVSNHPPTAMQQVVVLAAIIT